MKHFSNITTLIFDFGGVIINLDLPDCIKNIKNLGFEDVDKYLSNFGQSDFFLKFEKGEINTFEFREYIRARTQKPLTDIEIDAAWCSFLTDIPTEKLDLLAKLKTKFRLLLLSNTNPLHIEVNAAGEFEKVNKSLDYYFDKSYLSYEMGMTKPNEDIFNSLLMDAGVSANECLFLDDGVKNIETAKRLGFQTFLVDPLENLDFLLEIN